jgi:hypothetical protein
VIINVLFSHNGIDIGPVMTLKQNKIWTTRRLDVFLDWMKIRVTNNQLIENRMLVVNTLDQRQYIPIPL